MAKQTIKVRFGVIAVLILIAAFSRSIPHLPNLSPLGAIGLFSAAHFTKKWQVFLIPILATWLSDLYVNNVLYGQYFPTFTWFYTGFYWQYGSYLLITLSGLFIFRKVNIQRVLAGALTASVLFYVISNFGVWASGTMYPKTMSGLIACYVAGLPYLNGTLLGDVCYSAVLFGTFAYAQKHFPALQAKQYV
jgi:hypothetical protein